MKSVIYTIGHSTHTIDEFIKILHTYNIEEVIDIRTIPKSRHNPQFNIDKLKDSLLASNIYYKQMKGLGGFRHTSPASTNMAWKNEAFRGFADYMQTNEFEKSLLELINISRTKQVVIMCAEAVPWHCHRSLIGDALVVRNTYVEDIMNEKVSKPHKLTSWARVDGYSITYPKS